MAIIRKQHGHFLEDFRPGALLRHKGGKTVTEGLFAIFTDFSMTTNPLAKKPALRAGLRLPRPRRAARPRDGGRVQPERRGHLGERARQPRVHRHALRRPGLRRRHARGRDAGARREGVVEATRRSASSTCRRPAATSTARSCSTFQRKVQVWKKDLDARSSTTARRAARHRGRPRDLPPYDPSRLQQLAHSQQPRHLLRGLHRRRRLRALARPRRHDRPHHADRHPRQHLAGALQSVDGRRRTRAVRRRPADRLRRHPVQSLPRHLVGRHRRQRARATCATRPAGTPRRSSPATPSSPRPRSAGSATSPAVPTSASSATTLRGHKFVRKGDDGREGRDLLSRARAGAEAPQPLRVTP